MDFLLLILILGVFLLPTFFLSRQQRKRQQQVTEMQSALQPGDRIVTAGGMHGQIVALGADTLDLEIAPGVVATIERSVVVRHAEPAQPYDPSLGVPGTAGTAGADFPDRTGQDDPYLRPDDDGSQHPENRP